MLEVQSDYKIGRFDYLLNDVLLCYLSDMRQLDIFGEENRRRHKPAVNLHICKHKHVFKPFHHTVLSASIIVEGSKRSEQHHSTCP